MNLHNDKTSCQLLDGWLWADQHDTRTAVVVVLTLTRIIKSVVTGQAPFTAVPMGDYVTYVDRLVGGVQLMRSAVAP